jgi:hypothetical protein
MFATYHQNNPGDYFVSDYDAGITRFVIVEAASEFEAMDRALAIGIYFNGVEAGEDCECCGDRWSELYEVDTEPRVYGMFPAEYVAATETDLRMPPGREVCVHYADGRKEWF